MIGRALAFAALLCAAHAVPSSLVVETQYGPVVGQQETLDGPAPVSALVWRGIPYAAPPVGQLRWADPEAPTPWSSPLAAARFGPGCPQNCILPPNTCPARVSEDCLYLNVWAPLNADPSSPLPVMFFIHGGHYEQGSGEGPFYESSAAANFTGVVVVTINYRLGALGWLSSGDGTIDGNWGLKDQLMALKWVNINIQNFGGDPDQVTIYGESAGGTSVATLMGCPAAQGMFSRAIMESNPIGLPLMTPGNAAALASKFSSDTGCGENDIACLRDLSLDAILTAQSKAGEIFNIHDLLQIFYPWTPATQTSLLPHEPLKLFLAGAMSPVQFIAGTVNEEARLFVYSGFSGELSRLEYIAVVTFNFFSHLFSVLDMYPSVSGDNRDALTDLASDYLFTCPLRAAVRAHTAVNTTYLYRFNHVLSDPSSWGPNYTYCIGHVCHGSELPFVFDIVDNDFFPFTSDEQILGRSMVTAWSSFAVTGDPNVNGWSPYQNATDNDYQWAAPASAAGAQFELRKKFCDFWDSVGYSF